MVEAPVDEVGNFVGPGCRAGQGLGVLGLAVVERGEVEGFAGGAATERVVELGGHVERV